MLFTRCPDCETTFRVTAGALFKAAGKVRCGRCDTVFVADEELGSAIVSTRAEPEPGITAEAESISAAFFFVDSIGNVSTEDPNNRTEARSPDTEFVDDLPGTLWLEGSETPAGETRPAQPEEIAIADESVLEVDREDLLREDPDAEARRADGAVAPIAGASIDEGAATAAQREGGRETRREPELTGSSSAELDDEWAKFFAQAPASDSGPGAADDLLSVTADLEKADVLLGEVSEAVAGDAPDETRADEVSLDEEIDIDDDDLELGRRLAALAEAAQEPDVQEPKSRAWIVAAAMLALLLTGQATHYFRAELATQPVVGPALQAAYARFGMEIVPRWDLAQYEILDWAAAAQPSGDQTGTMRITARIRNNGPAAQPYPNIQLQLKDRWDQTVGSRVFSPREYLPADHIVSGLMAAGTTIPAELDLVDQVEEAYGFELDVCLDAPPGGIACVADTVFQ